MTENQPISLNLTLKQINVVLLALGKQPLEAVIETFVAIREQTERQIKAATDNPT